MNASEKKLLILALFFASVGLFARYSPFAQVPTLEEFAFVTQEPASEKSTVSAEVFPEKEFKPAGAEKRSKKTGKNKTYSFPIAVNSASLEELCALDGVGPKLAESIIAAREKNGPFQTGRDLKKVKGIGDKKLKNLLPYVIFD
ncbi:MAG: helix-hairpin-helix domain-containing protein [Fibrobacter sp.]|jgi:competence protein ComEA|nr:helix-hairpin-helix domain-containing protein [Fibrobacter sp.]